MDWDMFITILSDVMLIITVVSLLVPPIRKRILGQKSMEDGQKTIFRSEIVKIYYKNLENKSLRLYEYENLCALYKAYTARRGNSFVKKIYDEMTEWKVII